MGSSVNDSDIDQSSIEAAAPTNSEEIDQSSIQKPPVNQSDVDASSIQSPEQQNFSTPGQQALTMTEGFLGPLATGVENISQKMGVPGFQNIQQERAARAAANPEEAKWADRAGDAAIFMTPMGEAAEGASAAYKIGKLAVNGAIQGGVVGLKDELSKWLAGKADTTWNAAKNVALNSLFGVFGNLFVPGAGWAAEAGASKLGIDMAKNPVTSFLVGAGHSLKNFGNSVPFNAIHELDLPVAKDSLSRGFFEAGRLLTEKAGPIASGFAIKNMLPEGAGATAGWAAQSINTVVSNQLEKYLGKSIPQYAKDAAAGAFYKCAANGFTRGADSVIRGSVNLAKGSHVLDQGVKGLFSEGAKAVNDDDVSDDYRDKLNKWLENSGFQNSSQEPTQKYAEGGEVQTQGQGSFSDLYPDYEMAHQTAKGRIMGYLNTNRPSAIKTKLPYDSNFKNPEDERRYKEISDIAIKPMNILNKIKNGSLTQDQTKHFTSLYPELHQELSSRIHQQIVDDRLNERPKPPHKMRQALSLFLGTNLESSLTPQAIQLAQSALQGSRPQPSQGQPKPGALAKMGQMAQTGQQTRDAQSQKS